MLVYKFKDFTLEDQPVSKEYWYLINYTIKKGDKVIFELKRQSIFNNILEEWYKLTKLKCLNTYNSLGQLKYSYGKDIYIEETKRKDDWHYYEFVPLVEKELLTVC